MRCRVQGKRVPAVLRRGRRLRVVIFSEKTSHGKPRLPEMLHEQVQVADPRIREPVDNFELNRPEFVPPRARLALRQGVVEEPAALGLVRPCPSDVHLLEVHVGAVSAQSTRVGLHGEQRVLADAAARYVDKHDLAWPHQVEPLAVDVLHVRIADGGRCWRRGRSQRRRYGDIVNRDMAPTSRVQIIYAHAYSLPCIWMQGTGRPRPLSDDIVIGARVVHGD
mmetsp:Transcript_64794/g.168540  ORF Transcript_64794/g.168540 Transcript_64794/m.168540 type:complete len:222 (-) Transcript_64794:174-839(-)